MSRQETRHHSKGGFYFTRLRDGTVCVQLLLPPDPPKYPDEREIRTVYLNAAEWASVVAAMTPDGGTSASFAEAQRIHGGGSCV